MNAETPRLSAADDDVEARSALWAAIRVAAETVRQRRDIGIVHIGSAGAALKSRQVPEIETWRLVEALSLLAVLLSAREARASEVCLFGKTGPIGIDEDGETRYLWAQRVMAGETTVLGGRPDLVVTSTLDRPRPSNALRVIEAKCDRRLGAQTIRAEFGKAHDLRVGSYLIWSFYTPSPRVVEGARRLGLDVVPLGFDTEHRRDLVTQPEALVSHVANSLDESRRGQRFARVLLEAGREADRKLLDSGEWRGQGSLLDSETWREG